MAAPIPSSACPAVLATWLAELLVGFSMGATQHRTCSPVYLLSPRCPPTHPRQVPKIALWISYLPSPWKRVGAATLRGCRSPQLPDRAIVVLSSLVTMAMHQQGSSRGLSDALLLQPLVHLILPLAIPPPQPHPQRLEPSHVPRPAAPCEQDDQQVHRPRPEGQLHTVSSTLHPPQDPRQWAADPHEHTGPWLGHTHTTHTGSSFYHRQPAAAPRPAQSL